MIDGLVVVDKAAACTSHDVVGRCRRIFGQRRVGHAGTLDPDATGVLLVGLGRATRLLQFLTGMPKVYSGEIVLGVATTTLDSSGDVTGRWDMSGVDIDRARRAAVGLTGEIQQVPPMVSALKVGGRRLHELARAGIEVPRPPRPVVVHRFQITHIIPGPVLAVVVGCSSGTYVRSLAADLGTALGGGAHLRNLRRLAVGPFGVDQAEAVDQLGPASVLPPAAALGGMESVRADDSLAAEVAHGRVLDRHRLGVDGTGPWSVLGADGRLLAVYQSYPGGQAKPVVVMAPGDAG
ncbi:MAG: tRNA pseudouridine(55) synthase TruB [Acidimicrobiales bacterium]